MTQPFKLRERVKLSDLNSEYPSDHYWVFWKSPTPEIWGNLLYIFSLRERSNAGEDIPEKSWLDAQQAYFSALPEFVLDTGASGIDLSTPENVEMEMRDLSLDGELLRGIVADYIQRILDRRADAEKKAGALLARSNGSRAKSEAGSESPTAIGTL